MRVEGSVERAGDSDMRNRGRGRSGGQRRGIWEKCQQMQVDGKVEVEQVNM